MEVINTYINIWQHMTNQTNVLQGLGWFLKKFIFEEPEAKKGHKTALM